jgi:hypothetical protein
LLRIAARVGGQFLDDDDYRALIVIVSEELRASGAADLADERHYAKADEDTGETRLLDPPRRLIEMLEAFERFLAIQDREIYRAALTSIARTVEGEAPRRATVVLTTDDVPREVDLSETPDLSTIRKDLRRLIIRLLDGDLRHGGGEFA